MIEKSYRSTALRVCTALCALLKVVVSDKSGCGGWTYAVEKGMTTVLFPPKKGEEGEEWQATRDSRPLHHVVDVAARNHSLKM
jgi:hypothetical protein